MPDVKFSNQYPYTDFHELNLDWVIKEVKFWSERVGKSIQKIELTGTVGLVDTYTITYSDGSTSTFDVTNGNGIASVAKTGTAGLVDTYTITFQDGSTTTFEVHNGTATIDPTLTLSDYAADAKVVGDYFKNSEAKVTATQFIKGGTSYLSANLSMPSLYVSAGSGTASFTMLTGLSLPANTNLAFSGGNFETSIPTVNGHRWYLTVYNSANTPVQYVIGDDNVDLIHFVSHANADHMTILLQIYYTLAAGGYQSATAYNVQMWTGEYSIDTDLVTVPAPLERELLPNIVGSSNINEYKGIVLLSKNTVGRQYFSSGSTSVNIEIARTDVTPGTRVYFRFDSMDLDITPTTMTLGDIFIAKLNSGGGTIGYAYFTPDGWYDVETNVAKIVIYRTVQYTISTSAWGQLTTTNCFLSQGEISVNEDFTGIKSVEDMKRERVKPTETISGTTGNLVRIYNPYADKGANIYTGQLHCHSKFKQAGQWVYYAGSDEGLMQLMASCGYDFATITDYSHNGVLTEKPANTHGLVWLCNSQETSAAANSGLTGQHMCVYNSKRVYTLPTNAQPEYVAEMVTADGCSCDLAHPSWSDLYQTPEKVGMLRNKIRFCEIYDGLNVIDGTVTLPAGKSYDYAWEIMLDNGCVTWGTAVNDSHSGSDVQGHISKGCVHVFSDSRTAPAIWDALCKGAFVASSNVNAKISDISLQNGIITIDTGDSGATTVFTKESGTVLKTVTGTTATYDIAGDEKYIRAVVTLSSGEIVWCQPFVNTSYYDIDDFDYTY